MASIANLSRGRQDAFKYSSLLPEGSIRLLRILACPDRAAPIRCQLFDYALIASDRPSHLYEALSYAWGSPETTHSLFIDDRVLPITANLHAALMHLRDPHLDRVLWADAVCVNQKDLAERSRQVQFMPVVYSCASRVIVWLGEDKDDSKRAMETIRRNAVHKRQCAGSSTEAVIFALLGMSSDNPAAKGLLPNYETPWSSVLERVVTAVFGDDIYGEEHSFVISLVPTDDTSQLAGKEGNTRLIHHQCLAPIRNGDICCLMEGASQPSIIRIAGDHFRVIVSAIHHLSGPDQLLVSEASKISPVESLLAWDLNGGKKQMADDSVDMDALRGYRRMAQVRTREFTEFSDKKARLANVEQIRGLIERFSELDYNSSELDELRAKYKTAKVELDNAKDKLVSAHDELDKAHVKLEGVYELLEDTNTYWASMNEKRDSTIKRQIPWHQRGCNCVYCIGLLLIIAIHERVNKMYL
ncbi:heterokaryon incompatibility protein-domain-containing protein [Echria macrotheca]|uniref:Heterokaryon incompatibility protein-domain-containing protein n=1 Tax=Echria macrotheca TaxID=438768 RepID=A0AAJ0FAG9_9PEZI|nr:heterokaryon incompatibility protein-domain-containing protein [Echria macrotheca]